VTIEGIQGCNIDQLSGRMGSSFMHICTCIKAGPHTHVLNAGTNIDIVKWIMFHNTAAAEIMVKWHTL
jgi:hypothetical protein